MEIKPKSISGEELAKIEGIDLYYFVSNFDDVLLKCRGGGSLTDGIDLSVAKNTFYPLSLISDAYIKAASEEEFLSRFKRIIEKVIMDEKYNLKRVVDKITEENDKKISLYKIKNFIREKVTDEKFSIEDTLETLNSRIKKLDDFLTSECKFNINYDHEDIQYIVPENIESIAVGIALFESGYDVHSGEVFIKKVNFSGFLRNDLQKRSASEAYIAKKIGKDEVLENISENMLKFHLLSSENESINVYIEYDENLRGFIIKDTYIHSKWFFNVDEAKKYQLGKIEKMKEKIDSDYSHIVNK